MKKAIILLLILSIHYSVLSSTSVELRNQFEEACKDEKAANDLFQSLIETKQPSPLVSGYSGAVEAVLARYNLNPLQKYRFCKNGLSKLSSAIETTPASIELRYLRLIVEYNLPSFLSMSEHIDEDKNAILTMIKNSSDSDLNQRIANFLLSSNLCSNEEKIILSDIR